MITAQAALETRTLLRNGEQLLLTLIIPLLLLTAFSLEPLINFGTGLSRIDFLTPGIIALAVMSTAFTSQAIATGFERRYGVLKRLGATPLSRGGLIAAKTVTVIGVELLQGLLILAVGLAIGWRPNASPFAIVSAPLLILLGTAAFSGLALLMAGTLRAEATLAAANLVYILLLGVGGVVFPLTKFPAGARPVLELQSGGIPPSVPAADYLKLLSSFHVSPIDPAQLLDLVGLTPVARTPYKRLSGGQQQRLSLAAAVIGRPELVFLDEPTAGMDPQARHATWDLIGQLRTAGVSVILTTHFMEEAERLCDFVAIIDHGQLVAADTPAKLTGTVGQLRFRAEAGLDIDSLLGVLPPASAMKESPAGHYVIEVHGAVDPMLLATVTAWCAERGVLANSLRIESRTLEDVFLELTGKELRT